MKKCNFFAAVTCSLALISFAPATFAQDAQKEIEKQIANIISNTISKRVEVVKKSTQNIKDNNWYAGLNNISVEGAVDTGFGVTKFDTSSTVLLGGYDEQKDPSNITGVAFSYFSQDGFNSIGGYPYFAHILSDSTYSKIQMNFTGTSGSGFSNFGTGASYSYNWLKHGDNWVNKAGVGIGLNVSMDNNSNTSSGVGFSGNLETGYKISESSTFSVGANINRTNEAKSMSATGYIAFDSGLTNDVSLSLQYAKNIYDQFPSSYNFKVNSVTALLRMKY